MRHIAPLAVAVALLAAGCGSASDTGTSTTTVPTGLPSEVMSSIEADNGIPPKPDAATQAAFVEALDSIDPDIAHGDEEKAVSRARDTCSSVKANPDDRDKLVQVTNMRFTSPDHPDGFGTAKATKILAAVRKHICPTY